jgi:hypothetical protein
LHIQLNLNDSAVCIVNQTLSDQKNLTVSSELFDLHGKLLSSDQYQTSVSANKVAIQQKIKNQSVKDDVFFLRLKLIDNEKKLIDQNFYWLSQPGKSYEKLNDLKQVSLKWEIKNNPTGEKIAVISNPTNETAFFIRLKLVDAKSSELVLPVYFSDNYITLLPGENREIGVDMSLLPKNIDPKSVTMGIEGLNVKKDQ